MEKIQNNFLSPSIKNLSAGEGLAFYIGQLWKTLSVIGGLAFIIYFLLGGLSWLTAGGDKAKVESATKTKSTQRRHWSHYYSYLLRHHSLH